MNSRSKSQEGASDIIMDGPVFTDVINQLKEGRDLAITNAGTLMRKIVDAYSSNINPLT